MIGYGKRVLVVDDEKTMRLLLVEQLEQHGFVVVQAGDGRQALSELQRRHFDAVITDYLMPHLNGLDLLRHSRMEWPDLPVILLSGTFEQLAGPATAEGAFACLPKPFNSRLLIDLLSTAVDQHAAS